MVENFNLNIWHYYLTGKNILNNFHTVQKVSKPIFLIILIFIIILTALSLNNWFMNISYGN